MSGPGVKTLDIHAKGKSHLPQCPPSNKQKLKSQAYEKDEATESENKEQSASIAMKETTAQLCFIKQEAIKAEMMSALK